MLYFVASDDIVIANQIRSILVQLRQECPALNVVRLAGAIVALETATASALKISLTGLSESDNVILVVLTPDSEQALALVRDLRRRTTARILTVGPATNTKLILRAMREGAAEYLDINDLPSEVSEALDRMNTASKAGRMIALLAPSGGSGASTLAVNIATVLAQKHGGCLLMDLKLEAGDLAPLLDLKPNHTLSDLCQNIERFDYSLLKGCLTISPSGVQLLAAPLRIADVASITPKAIDLIVPLVRRHFPLIVLDVDHTYRSEQLRVLQQSDVIGLVLRLDFVSLRNARTTLEFLQQNGVSRDKVRIVANRWGEPNQLTAAQVEESLGLKIVEFIPEDARTVNRANNSGIPLVLQSPSTKIARRLTDLAVTLADPTNAPV